MKLEDKLEKLNFFMEAADNMYHQVANNRNYNAVEESMVTYRKAKAALPVCSVYEPLVEIQKYVI